MKCVFLGKGSLIKFASDYALINSVEGQETKASNLFPTGKTINPNDLKTPEPEHTLEFEYVIYYDKCPVAEKPKEPEIQF